MTTEIDPQCKQYGCETERASGVSCSVDLNGKPFCNRTFYARLKNQHKHKYKLKTYATIYNPNSCAVCDCGESLTQDEVEERVNEA